MAESDHLFTDKVLYAELVKAGQEAIRADYMDRLRKIR